MTTMWKGVKGDDLNWEVAGRMGGGRGDGGGWRVSVVFAAVNFVPEHNYGGKRVADARVVLNVVEPSRHIHVLLLLLDGQVHLRDR